MLPEKIGRYEILGELAKGGMAEILLGRLSGAGQFRRAVVIKRVLRRFAGLDSFVTMFLDEARTVAQIRHPNVIQVHELGQDGDDLFLVMEYVAGENTATLLERLASKGRNLPASLAAHIVAEACAGLHAAHELVDDMGKAQHVVHRDVSLQNVFVTYDGHVKVLDFGIASSSERLASTEVGQVKGKLEYMSPEQARGRVLDRRSDVFSLGIVLYELSTGRRLFQRSSYEQAVRAICDEPIVPPSRVAFDAPTKLDELCMRALAKKPEDRYQTAAEMRRDLLEIVRVDDPTEALADTMREWFPDRIVEKASMLQRALAVAQGEVLARPADGPQQPEPIKPAAKHAQRAGLRVGLALLAASALFVGVALSRRTPDASTTPRPAGSIATTPPDDRGANSEAEPQTSASLPETAPTEPGRANRRRPATKTNVARSAATPSDTQARTEDCDPPYTFATNGHRVYKKACLVK